MFSLILPFLIMLSVFSVDAADDIGPTKIQPEPVTVNESSDVTPYIALAIYEGRLIQARTMLDNLGETSDAAEPTVRLLWAELAVAQRRFGDARLLLKKGGFGDDLQCRVDAANGTMALETGSMDRAIGLLGDATNACPQDWRSWNRLAILLAQRNEYLASRYAFLQAIELSRGAAKVHGNFAYALMQQDKVEDASIELAAALDKQPEDARLLALQDRLNGMKGIEPQRQDGESPEIWARRLAHAGQGAKDAGYERLATALFARALLISPRFDAESWSNLQILMENAP